MTSSSDYVPPKVWVWDKPSGGQFANINRPIAGATHEKALPVGRHPAKRSEPSPVGESARRSDVGIGSILAKARDGLRCDLGWDPLARQLRANGF